MLKLDLDERAERFVEKRPRKHRGQIYRKLGALCDDPFPPDSKFLAGYKVHRADVGEYRIIYRVDDQRLNVFIIGKRNDDEVYKQLKRIGG